MNEGLMRLGRTILMLGLVAVPPQANAFIDTVSKWFQRTPYPIVHSKHAVVSRGPFYRLSWIDNDRIFFAGEPVEEVLARYDGKKFVGIGKVRFYVWNTRTNQVMTYREDVDSFGTYCYNEFENWIRYPIRNNRNEVMEGPFGAEKSVAINPADHTIEGRNRRRVFFSELTCREHPYAPEDSGAGSLRTLPLHNGHGVLDAWGRQDDERPIKYFSSEYQLVRELELPRRAIYPGKTYYSRYKSAYVLSGFTAPPSFSNRWGSWPEGVDQQVFLLSPTGILDRSASIPWKEGYREALSVYVTAKGLAYVSGSPPRQQGFYLVSGSKSILLLSATEPRSLVAGGESPDGCKLAVALSNYAGNKEGGLASIDLCNGGGR